MLRAAIAAGELLSLVRAVAAAKAMDPSYSPPLVFAATELEMYLMKMKKEEVVFLVSLTYATDRRDVDEIGALLAKVRLKIDIFHTGVSAAYTLSFAALGRFDSWPRREVRGGASARKHIWGRGAKHFRVVGAESAQGAPRASQGARRLFRYPYVVYLPWYVTTGGNC
jgi:hypothetical protein